MASIPISCGSKITINSNSSINVNNPSNFKVTTQELNTYDQYAFEHVRQVGTLIDYYVLDKKNSKVDALYDEPLARKFIGPTKLYVYVSWPNPEFMVREEGTHVVFMSAMWMARKEAEIAGIGDPHPGDIVRFWNIPYYNKLAANDREIQGAGMFFDVIEVKDDGHLYDTPYFVGFRIDIKRRSEFGAERKLGEL